MNRLLFSFILIVSLAASARAGQPLVLGYGGTSLSHISIVILQQAYASLGISTECKWMPAARSLFMADTGHTDGEVNRIAAIAPDHPDLIRIDVPINRIEAIALTCRKPIKADLQTLASLRVGVKTGNIYAEQLVRGMPSVMRNTNEDILLDLLLEGRVDVLITDRMWALSLKLGPRYPCLFINTPPLVEIPLYHYLHRRHADIIPEVTRVLREMRDSGRMEAIREKILNALAES